jgi:hypothetical protein
MQYSDKSAASSLAVTLASPGDNKLIEPKAYLDLEDFQCWIAIVSLLK